MTAVCREYPRTRALADLTAARHAHHTHSLPMVSLAFPKTTSLLSLPM